MLGCMDDINASTTVRSPTARRWLSLRSPEDCASTPATTCASLDDAVSVFVPPVQLAPAPRIAQRAVAADNNRRRARRPARGRRCPLACPPTSRIGVPPRCQACLRTPGVAEWTEDRRRGTQSQPRPALLLVANDRLAERKRGEMRETARYETEGRAYGGRIGG